MATWIGRDLTVDERDTVEKLIDACTLKALLEAISGVCGEKSDHILASYNDKATARAWREAEGFTGVCSVNVRV